MKCKGDHMGKGTEMGKCSWACGGKASLGVYTCKAVGVTGGQATKVGKGHTRVDFSLEPPQVPVMITLCILSPQSSATACLSQCVMKLIQELTVTANPKICLFWNSLIGCDEKNTASLVWYCYGRSTTWS